MRLREYVPYYKRLLRLAAPVVLAQAGQLTTQFADTAMVGNYGGEDAVPLAAVSLGSSLFLLIYLAAMGFAMSITPLVGEHYARNDRRMVGHLFQNGIAYSLIIGVISTLVALALRPFIGVLGVWMSGVGSDVTAVTEMALPYYDMLVWSIMPLMVFLAVKQFLEGIGNTKVAMWITLVGNFLNILLNWVFIFGRWGFEALPRSLHVWCRCCSSSPTSTSRAAYASIAHSLAPRLSAESSCAGVWLSASLSRSRWCWSRQPLSSPQSSLCRLVLLRLALCRCRLALPTSLG